MQRYLTKSAFKAARSCPTKLYYYNYRYPNTLDEDEYLQLLAEGGYVIGKLAQVLHPGGIEIEGPLEEALDKTTTGLEKENVTLFEAAVSSGGMLVRVDILERTGKTLRIIEVKSKSVDSVEFADEGPAYFRKSSNGWTEHIEDVAFQRLVVSRAFPEMEIETCLFLPDKSKPNKIAGLSGWFSVAEEAASQDHPNYNPPKISFTGDADALIRDNFMTMVDVGKLVDEIMPDIEIAVPRFLDSIARNERIIVPPAAKCAKCEYTKTDPQHPKSGFEICWGERAYTEPHILTLGHLGNFNRNGQIDNLISSGKSSLYDVPAGLVKGKHHNRPYYQATRQAEFLAAEFATEVLTGLSYPLHFIDFETNQSAVPFYRAMRPYDRVLFQWSCHTMRSEGGPLEHDEWLHDQEADPNVTFGKTLARRLGTDGTLLTWSAYENTQLAYLYRYLLENDIDEPGLSGWVLQTARIDEKGGERILDLNKVALEYYYHPLMGARTSIKVTLPAILSSAGSLDRIREILQAEGLYQLDTHGNIVDPYSLLPQIEAMNETARVAEGTGAMIAYQKMAYGNLPADERNKYRSALLRYCSLDTLAMVLIWEYWVALSKRT